MKGSTHDQKNNLQPERRRLEIIIFRATSTTAQAFTAALDLQHAG
jgi:hypothetical protein